MRILFVDDEPKVLQGLQRMLWRMRKEWDMHFASSGAEALRAEGEAGGFDVVVSDVRMPEMDGVELLTTIKERSPGVIRIVLSGHADQEVMLTTIGPAHQYLSKPCDANTLVATVKKAVAVRDTVSNPALKDLVSRMDRLPSLPSLYVEIMEELRSPEPSLHEVGKIVSKDVAMTAKVLQLVNSAFFGLQQHISDPVRAVAYLGADTLKAVALTAQAFEELSDDGVDLESLWSHCMRTAMLARRIAEAAEAPDDVVDNAFQAAFLHDIGVLVIAVNMPGENQRILERSAAGRMPRHEAERELLGSTHAEIGGYLLGLWGLPNPIVEAVTFHHTPARLPGDEFTALCAVHAADVVERQGDGRPDAPDFDSQYLARLGLDARIPEWREIGAATSELGASP